MSIKLLLHPVVDASAANGVTSPASGTDEEKAGKRVRNMTLIFNHCFS